MKMTFPVKACISLASLSFFMAACGDKTTVENITQVSLPGMEAVAGQGELPDCDSLNIGEQVWVKDEASVFICTDEGWFRAKSTEEPYSCETQKLADSTGIKILCNGDSVGVLLNGLSGKNGANGRNAPQSCSAEQIVGTTFVRVSCQKDTLVFDLNTNPPESSSAVESSSEELSCSSEESLPQSSSSMVEESSSSYDEEAVLTPLDSVKGFSQKGPFVQGSNVRLYELTDGRTLRQTNGNFMGVINSSDGFFKITARNLKSQYALLVANGYYRNEVTGETTTEDLTLFALSNFLFRRTANVNLLTHLEYDRVQYLVTQKKIRFDEAKQQAKGEILWAFRIDTTGVGESEDLAVFGSGKGNAALLAISVMLQSWHSIADLTELLSEISADLEKDGALDTALTTKIADDAVPLLLLLPRIRANVEGWGLGEVPEFEPIIKNFVASAYGFEVCAADENGLKGLVQNKYSRFNNLYYACENGNLRFKMLDTRSNTYYNVAAIGPQIWMAEDLIVLREDDYPMTSMHWSDAIDSTGLANDPVNPRHCGTGDETPCVFDEPLQGVCPDGWHIPSKREWAEQRVYVAGSTCRNTPISIDGMLKSKDGWYNDGYGTDEFGFAAVSYMYYQDPIPEWASANSFYVYYISSSCTYLRYFGNRNDSAKGCFDYDETENYSYCRYETGALRCIKD